MAIITTYDDASSDGGKMTPTKTRHMATFLLEMALDQERVRQRIAARLLAWRQSKNLIQPDAARQIGISNRQYQRLEAGHSTARWATIDMVADGLGISVEDLIGEGASGVPARADSPPKPSLRLDDDRFALLLAELTLLRSGQVEIQASQEQIERRLDALATQLPDQVSGQGSRSDADL